MSTGAEPTHRRLLRAFLIADIRGYSTFAEIRGPEAAAALAARFVAIATGAVTEHAGTVADIRGDEVFAVFESPRDALVAALALQQQLVIATRDDTSLPVPVGIGVDFGEAVAESGEWSGTAINVAARLCSLARGGEILATEAITNVVDRIDGARFIGRGTVSLKGIARVVRFAAVTSNDLDARAELRRAGLGRAAVHPRAARRRRLVTAAVAVIALVVAAVVLAIELPGRAHRSTTSRLAPDSVGLLDESGTRRADLGLGAEPGPVATDRDGAWVVGPATDTVTRLDAPQHDDPAVTVPVGARPDAVALGAGAVWVANSAGRSVSRINETGVPTVADTIAVGNDPSAVAVGYRRVWVANSLDGTVSVIDPVASAAGVADRVVATIPVGSQPDAIATGSGGVWVAVGATATVLRIDPSSLQVSASVGVGNDPSAVAVNNSGVWVANSQDGTVSRIDPRTAAVVRTVQVGRSPVAISATHGDVWVADADSDDVRDIAVRSSTVSRVLRVGYSPAGVAAHRGQVWVPVGEASSAHRGGTLRVVESDDLQSLDPAYGYSQLGWNIESVVQDGLVTFQRTAGPSGAIVVPDLAVRLPAISSDGLTYTFQLRRGIRYSDGATVVAGDVRSSFERLLRSTTAPPYYGNIVGASACSAAKPRCDLSQGIRTDDAAGTVQFTLSKADPDFLDQLAIPFADVLPAGTPSRDLGFTPRPATGPYVISSSSAHGVTLRRNPHFVPWSDAAQPPGRPDRIVIAFRTGAQQGVSDVDTRATIAGRYDWSADPVTPTLLDGLLKTSTSQVHAFPDNSVRYFFLNTTRAPFDDVRVRRAVNFAVDRRAEVAAFGGPNLATTTCQTIPPSLPGYQPNCPYTARPNSSGTWTAPDLAAARALIRQARATGARVRVVTLGDKPDPGRVLVKAMRAIGLDATLSVYRRSDQSYYNYIGTRSNHVQAGLEAWVVDYPSPSNLFGPLLRCSARTATQNLDESLFCDRAVDRDMDSALADQVTAPTAGDGRWAGVDRRVTALAPWVPLVNGRVYDAVSRRLGNFEANPEFGMLIDQAWVK